MAERAGGRITKAARNLDRALELLSERMLAEAQDPAGRAGCRELGDLAKTIRQAVELRQALGETAADEDALTVVMDPDVKACAE